MAKKSTSAPVAVDTDTETLTSEALGFVLTDTSIVRALSVSFDKDAKKAGRTHEITAAFTFDGMTLGDVLEKAMRCVVIDFQRALRTAPDEDALKAFAETGSKDEPLVVLATEAGHSPWSDGTRKKADPMTAAKRALARMTDEERAAFLDALA
jgi:hypothetical protein